METTQRKLEAIKGELDACAASNNFSPASPKELVKIVLPVVEAISDTEKALVQFDESSRRLTRWLIGLTVVLVILTGVIAWFTILLVRRA